MSQMEGSAVCRREKVYHISYTGYIELDSQTVVQMLEISTKVDSKTLQTYCEDFLQDG